MRIADAFSSGHVPVSFEIFPPKGDLTLDTARETAARLARLGGDFISVTYSAGGSGNSAATAEIAQMIQQEFGVTSMAHLTCVALTRSQLKARVDDMRSRGIGNVLALRGDPTAAAPKSDFTYAADVIPALVEAGFCVGAAAYPEGHIDCMDLDVDIERLKAKQDAGASFFVTQLFFDNDCFYRFRERAERAGITVPITAGIMPFLGKDQISRMVFMCGASLPSPVIKLLARYADDKASLRAAGIEYACNQLVDLKRHGAQGLHVYTMNHPDIAEAAVAAVRAAG